MPMKFEEIERSTEKVLGGWEHFFAALPDQPRAVTNANLNRKPEHPRIELETPAKLEYAPAWFMPFALGCLLAALGLIGAILYLNAHGGVL